MFNTRLSKIITFFILVIAQLPQDFFAQGDSVRFHLALRAGVGASFVHKINYLSQQGYQPTNLGSFLCGLSGVYTINKFLSVGVDLHYNFRGTNYQRVNDSLISVTYGQNGGVQKTESVYFYSQNMISSVDIPVYLKFGNYNNKTSPYIDIGFNSSFTLKYSQREYLWAGYRQIVKDVKITDMNGRYYPGVLIAAGLKHKRFLFQLSYTTYPKTKVFYFNFSEKVNTYSIIFSTSFLFF